MIEDLYSVHLPKKTYPWCYLSLEIDPKNIDVNVHPTKHEVRFLHEDAIIEKVKIALDEKLSGVSGARTFYMKSKLPNVDVTKDILKEVLPDYNSQKTEKTRKLYDHEMIRTNATDQKLDRFSFTVHSGPKKDKINDEKTDEDKSKGSEECQNEKRIEENSIIEKDDESKKCENENIAGNQIKERNSLLEETNSHLEANFSHLEDVSNLKTSVSSLEANVSSLEANVSSLEANVSNLETNVSNLETNKLRLKTNSSGLETLNNLENNAMQEDNSTCFELSDSDESNVGNPKNDKLFDMELESADSSLIADKALERIYKHWGGSSQPKENKEKDNKNPEIGNSNDDANKKSETNKKDDCHDEESTDVEFKSYSVNDFRREVKLKSILMLRKKVEDNYHAGLREIFSKLIFVGCVDEGFSLIQSGTHLYICNTQKLV